ncbi:MAG: transaldolase [Pseudomonadota bacterium]
MSRLKAVAEQGQSIWLDYIRRDLVEGDGLAKLIREDGLSGLTSNPAIFEKAIAGSTLYDPSLGGHVRAGQHDPEQLVELLAIEDIRMAADAFWSIHHESQARDGYVSLEVSPRLASDTRRTLDEAVRLWHTVGRPNLMIKVPGTAAGVPVVRALIAQGINVNVTLLFSRKAYVAVAEAYLQGLEDRVAKGQAIDGIGSVASFFISRIDAVMDAELTARGGDATTLIGSIAIANAKLAYQDFLALSATPRWQALAARGAQPQRLLWASTGTKNPAFRDTLYVEQLIGPQTVNTVPPATLDAFRDHGEAERTLDAKADTAAMVMAAVQELGLPFEAATDQLVVDGVKLFVEAWDKLLLAVAAKRDALIKADE